MATKPITPRLHGVLDYATGAKLALVLPGVLRLQGTRTGRLLRIAGAAHVGYSLLTRYELGVRKLIPYRTHLMIDAGGAAALVAAPWLLGTKGDGIRGFVPLAAGLCEAAAVALSDPVDGRITGEVKLGTPDPANAVMPDGAEANASIGARTIGRR